MHALADRGRYRARLHNVLQAVSGGAALIERRPDDSERVLRYVRMVVDAAKRGAPSPAFAGFSAAVTAGGDVDGAALLTDMRRC